MQLNCYPSLLIQNNDLSFHREQHSALWFFCLSSLTSFYVIYMYLSVISIFIHTVCPSLSLSISFFPSVYPGFLWKVMIHWLWSPRAVSLKSVCLLSATTEWYITYIPCNFLGFIRCIYSPYNGEDCSFQQSSECLSLPPQLCSWKPLSAMGMGTCQDQATKFLSR